MAENGTSPEATTPQEPVRPPEGERSVVKNALNKTAKILFPFAGMAKLLLREDLEEVYRESTAKKIKAGVTAFGGLVDVGRWAGVANFAVQLTDWDSPKGIIGSGALATYLLLSPKLFKGAIDKGRHK